MSTETRLLTIPTIPFLHCPCYLPKQSKITSFLAGSVTVLLSSMSASTWRNNWALLLLIAFVLQCISMDISFFHVVGQLFWLQLLGHLIQLGIIFMHSKKYYTSGAN